MPRAAIGASSMLQQLLQLARNLINAKWQKLLQCQRKGMRQRQLPQPRAAYVACNLICATKF